MAKITWRQERKHYINMSDALALRSRLRILAKPDENAGPDGTYTIRSLYFDNYSDKAVVEKLAGVNQREKFRLRYYGGDLNFIRLEKKSKIKRLTNKQSAQISREECEQLLRGNYAVLMENAAPVARELYAKMQGQVLRPRTIVDYSREAYVYPLGNVRVTIDSHIRMSEHIEDFLCPDSVMIPAANAIVLEIKFDEFLPDVIQDAVQLSDRRETEFSKYIVSRLVT